MRIGPLRLLERNVIGDDPQDPLLIRHVVFRLPAFGVFVHKLCRSDHDRALHDHPWSFVSVILKNGYKEIVEGGSVIHGRGDVFFRPAEWKHRVVIEQGRPSWNLVFVGRRRRRWGFWINGNWCWWRKYDSNLGICSEQLLVEGDGD